jgi:hypothetical protein
VRLIGAFSFCPSEASRYSVDVYIHRQNFGVKCIHHYAFCNFFRNSRETNKKCLLFSLGLAPQEIEIAAAGFLIYLPKGSLQLEGFHG